MRCAEVTPEVPTGDTMGGGENERFNLIRRSSLRNEVDGSFEELEDVEDSSETPPSNSKGELRHRRAALVGGGRAWC